MCYSHPILMDFCTCYDSLSVCKGSLQFALQTQKMGEHRKQVKHFVGLQSLNCSQQLPASLLFQSQREHSGSTVLQRHSICQRKGEAFMFIYPWILTGFKTILASLLHSTNSGVRMPINMSKCEEYPEPCPFGHLYILLKLQQ